jgi:hypothetical protein
MAAELLSQSDPHSERVHGVVAAGVWGALSRFPALDGQWKVRIFGDHPPEIRVVVISPQGLQRHWTFERAEAATSEVIESDLAEWLAVHA